MIPTGFKTKEELDFPNIINVCVYKGQCTANCIHCPVGITPLEKRIEKFGNTQIELSTFKNIVDQISKHKHCTLRIHSVGEPLLWNNLYSALEYAKEKNIRTWIFSNGITTNKVILKHLVNYTSIIEISINSIDIHDYKKTKGTDTFELVKSNVIYMHEEIKKNNLKTRLIVSRVQSTDKKYDEEFIKYWKETGFVSDAFIRSFHNYNDLIDLKLEGKKIISACSVHWTRFNIDCNGNVVICYNELFKGSDLDPKFIIGNILKTPIIKIWKGEKLNQIRKAQLNNNYELLKFTDKIPCQNCM